MPRKKTSLPSSQPNVQDESKLGLSRKEYKAFMLDQAPRTTEVIFNPSEILSADELKSTRSRRRSLELPELTSQLATNEASPSSITIEQRSTEVSLWFRNLIQSGSLQAPEINKKIINNRKYELTIRRLVIFGLMHDSITQSSDFVEILNSINFSGLSLAIIFSTPNLSKKAREIAFNKLLQADDLEFKVLDTIFDFTQNLSKLEGTVKQKFKTLRAEKLAGAEKAKRSFSLLLHAIDNYKDNSEMLLLVREHCLSRFANKSNTFTRHEVDAEGNTFLHLMLNRDDPNCEQLNALIELLFSADSALGKEHSKHFATALIVKNKNGISPINLILQKGLDWHEAYEILTKMLIVVLVDLMLISDAEWDNIFSEHNDCFSNTGNRNLVTTLFDAKQFLLLDTIISMRLLFRQEFNLWFMQELNARMDRDSRYFKLDPRVYARRCAAIIGVNEYSDIYHADDEDRNKTRLLNLIVKQTEYVVFSATEQHNDFKDATDQQLGELGLSQSDLALLDVFNKSKSFSDAARRIPAHEHRIFRKLLGEYTKKNPTQERIEIFWNAFVAHHARHLFEIDSSHGGVCALSEAILYCCTDLVRKLCETYDIDIHPKYLLVAAVKENLQNGMFEYLLRYYMKKQATTNSCLYLPIDKVRDPNGIGLLYRTLILGNNIEMSRQLIALGCQAIEFYAGNESLLSQVMYKAYIDEINIEDAIRQIKFLTSECGNVKILMTKKNANGHEPLPLFLKLVVLHKKIPSIDAIAVIDMLIDAGAPLEYKLVGNETLLHICSPMDITIFAYILKRMSDHLTPKSFKQTLEQKNTSGFSVLDLLTVQLKFDTSAKADIQKRIDQIRSYGAEPSRGLVVARLTPSPQ